MKILLVCKSLPPTVIGGIQTHTWKLSEWLIHLGHEVSILTAGKWRKGIRRGNRDGRNILEIPYLPGRKLPFFSVWAEEWAFNQAASQWLRHNSEAFDIVHVQGRSGFCLPEKAGETPVVATFHGLISVENEYGGNHQNPGIGIRLHEYWASFFEKQLLARADACIAVSREMVRSMEAALPGVTARTTILPNGVDVPDDMETLQNQPKASGNLLFVGRLQRIKGIFPLIEAFQHTHPAIHLTIVGDGPDRAELEKRIAATRLHHRITLTGALPQEQVFEKIKASFALVAPSLYETQGIVLLEANACGKPVITSDIPAIQEVVQHGLTGLTIPSGDVQRLAAAINYLFDNPAEAARMGEAGCQHVRDNFSWEKIALDTERLYGQVLAQKIQSKGAKTTGSGQHGYLLTQAFTTH